MRDSIEPRGSAAEEETARVHEGRLGPVHVRSVFVGTRRPGRVGLIALAIAAVVIGGAFLALGLLLLTALVASGAVIGGGYLLWRRMRGVLGGHETESRKLELDPALEIRAPGDIETSRETRPSDGRR